MTSTLCATASRLPFTQKPNDWARTSYGSNSWQDEFSRPRFTVHPAINLRVVLRYIYIYICPYPGTLGGGGPTCLPFVSPHVTSRIPLCTLLPSLPALHCWPLHEFARPHTQHAACPDIIIYYLQPTTCRLQMFILKCIYLAIRIHIQINRKTPTIPMKRDFAYRILSQNPVELEVEMVGAIMK